MTTRRKRRMQIQIQIQNVVFFIMLFVVVLSNDGINKKANTTTATTTTEDKDIKDVKNKFSNGGCLYQKKANWTKIRVCGSDDPVEFSSMGYCRHDTHPFDDYMEIRIHSQNWESSIFLTWIVQIVLSEILNVPTSVETSSPTAKVDFYDPNSKFDLHMAKSDDFDCLIKGSEIGDCRNRLAVTNAGKDEEIEYESCCHFIPEFWNSELKVSNNIEKMKYVEPTVGMGIIGEERWFIPKFTAIKDPTLTGYMGLSGELNRHKLAKLFKRPTTWKQYCDEVSTTNCMYNDNDTDTVVTASRPPTEEDGDDAHRFFVDGGLYNGYFRYTKDNDCGDDELYHPKTNNNSCTGHIFDYPCGWTSYVGPTTYHLNIALKGGGNSGGYFPGYSYNQLIDGLKAANATKSDMIIFWWTPEALYQQFVGTDMELTRITMPPVTQECLDHLIPPNETCTKDFEKSIGSPLGVCSEAPNSLKKFIIGSLYKLTYGGGDDSSSSSSNNMVVEPALISPGYETLKSFQISGAEVGQLFDYWTANKDNPREAVCDWVIDNFDTIQNFIPRTYPRVVVDDYNNMKGDPLTKVSLIIATVTVLAVGMAMVGTYLQRSRDVLKFAQLEFLWLLLIGLGLVSFGSLLLSLPPTNQLCVATIWMTNLGYTLELVPLIVKMAAIHTIMSASKKLRHVVLTRKQLFGAVCVISGLVVMFLVAWTVFDPPRKEAEYEVTSQQTDAGETIVASTYFCGSTSDGWRYTSVAWHLGMLVIATIQTFQTRKIRQEINESQTLAIMIYSHFIFVCLRLVTFFLEESLSQADMMQVRSIINSLDCFVVIIIYFVPKFLSSDDDDVSADEQGGQHRRALESQTVKQLRMLAAIATAHHENQVGGGSGVSSTSNNDPQNFVANQLRESGGSVGLAESVSALGIEPSALFESLPSKNIKLQPIDESYRTAQSTNTAKTQPIGDSSSRSAISTNNDTPDPSPALHRQSSIGIHPLHRHRSSSGPGGSDSVGLSTENGGNNHFHDEEKSGELVCHRCGDVVKCQKCV